MRTCEEVNYYENTRTRCGRDVDDNSAVTTDVFAHVQNTQLGTTYDTILEEDALTICINVSFVIYFALLL